MKKTLRENSTLDRGFENGKFNPPDKVPRTYDNNENLLKHKFVANFVDANHGKFITLIADQLIVLSHSAFKTIYGELSKKSILYKLNRLGIYLYKWKSTGIETAGFIAEELWKIFQHPDLPEKEKIKLVRLKMDLK